MKGKISLKGSAGAVSKIVIDTVENSLAALLPVPAENVVIITDANLHRTNRTLVDAHRHIIIGQGETSKTLKTIENIYKKLLELGADRSTFIVGMGGGIVTDITGFVAATYMRGLRFGFVATSLLGQVDACIGGKNGVNFDGFKNIIGTIRQPEFVICDISRLKTLPMKEFRTGLVEVVKAAIVGDKALFELMEAHSPEEIRNDEGLLREIITRSIKVKACIVQRDELEKNERRKLNLGHTFGHAIEKNVPGITHGEAVAAGTVMISDMAVRIGMLSPEDNLRIRGAMARTGISTEHPVEVKKLLAAIRHDKKRESDNIYLSAPTSVGSCEIIKMTLPEFEELFMARNMETV
jgi:3-dehydroquinate synthase